jgi:hypothetical protein
MQHGVAQLEQLFAKSKADQKVLEQLEHELQYRQVPRAVALLAEVQAAMYLAAPGAPAVAPQPSMRPPTPPVLQPDLWERRAVPPVAASPAAVQPHPLELTAGKVVPPPPASQPHAGPAMSIDEAYKVLKVAPSSTWESIEQARRRSVQQAHPQRLKSMSTEKRMQIQSEAKRVNAAYAVLALQRGSAN